MARTPGVIRLSKNKPKETIEFVIRLQDKERQLIEGAIAAYQINKVATPIADLAAGLFSTREGVAIFLSILAATIGFVYVDQGGEIGDLFSSFMTQREQAIAEGVIGTTVAWGPFWPFSLVKWIAGMESPDWGAPFDPVATGVPASGFTGPGQG